MILGGATGNQNMRNLQLQVVQENVRHSYSSLRRWRPQVIALRASKDLKKLFMEELLGMLKVHQMKLNEDERQWKGKSITLKA
ncbi:hypothetical protein CR513_24934, partial [Mucuna pruriens]